MDWESQLVRPDENEEYKVAFQRPAERVEDDDRPINPKTGRSHKKKIPTGTLRLFDDAAKLVDRNDVLTDKLVSLSNWVYPGISGRFANEGSWEGKADLTILVMLAPITCVFKQLHNELGTWAIVVPDVRDLEDFDNGRRSATLAADLKWVDVASLADAGFRFLSEYQTKRVRAELDAGCRVVAMGKVGYYQSQSIRKGVVDVPADAKTLRRYRLLEKHLGNRWMPRKVEENQSNTKKKKDDNQLRAAGFVSVPTVRGRIADNLILKLPWYANLSEPLPWDMNSLDRQRKRQPGKSILRLHFNNLGYQRRALMELIREDEMWDNPNEREFVEAFWETLGALYYREREAVERGGSRSWGDRLEDLNEELRRGITRTKTGPLLRETLAEVFARPVKTFRSKHVRKNPGLVWRPPLSTCHLPLDLARVRAVEIW